MNFLDLSAVSEEERRLINEILSDTSDINIAFSSVTPSSTEPNQRPQQKQHKLRDEFSNEPLRSGISNHIKSSTDNSTGTTNLGQPHLIPELRQKSNQQINVDKNASLKSGTINHINNHKEIDYTVSTSNSGLTNSILKTDIKQQQFTTNEHSNFKSGINNHINSNNDSSIVVTSACGMSTLTQNLDQHGNTLPIVYTPHATQLQQHQMPSTMLTAKPLDAKSSSLKNQGYNSQSTSANLRNSTSGAQTVPATAQMPPQMAGDMNSVIGLNMTSTQPQSYAIPPSHPYGPPPHQVYTGPPLIHYYNPNFLGHYALPFMPYLGYPPHNSFVPPRQQVPPQSNQPSPGSSTVTTTRPHSPSQTQYPPQKVKNYEQYDNTNNIHANQSRVAKEEKPQSKNSTPPQSNRNVKRNNSEKELDENHQMSPKVDNLISNPDNELKHSNDISSGVKQASNEVVLLDATATDKSPEEKSSNERQVEQCSTDKSSNHKPQSYKMDATKKSSPETESAPEHELSASSKSWASLFKRGNGTLSDSQLNGDAEQKNYSSEGSDYEGKAKKSSTKVQNGIKSTNQVSSTKESRSQEAAKRALDKMAPKLAQKINSLHLKHSLPFLKPRGFINKGNGCYINATLQALIACPPFYNLMKEIADLRVFRRENSCTPIIDSFAELFLNFPPLDTNKKNKQSSPSDQKLQIGSLQAEAMEPKCIYNVLGQIKSECLKGAQEDAEEFLSSVLNGLHEEMISLGEVLPSHNSTNNDGRLSEGEDLNDDNLWREVGPRNRSLPIRTAKVINTPIQEIFGGSLFSIRTAGKDRCGHRSPFFDLQLDISSDSVKSIQDAIMSFTATEIINDFYCSKTKQKLDAQRRTSLDQLPPILILHLKQFVYSQDQGLKKLMKKIDYQIDFELLDSCLHEKSFSDKAMKNSRSYKLLAVVYHDGKEAVKGHYLTDIYHIGSSQWIRCDDANLKVVPSPRIDSPDSYRTPYLLFYRRLNTLRAQTNNNDNKKKS